VPLPAELFSGANVDGVLESEMVVVAAGLYASQAKYTRNGRPITTKVNLAPQWCVWVL